MSKEHPESFIPPTELDLWIKRKGWERGEQLRNALAEPQATALSTEGLEGSRTRGSTARGGF